MFGFGKKKEQQPQEALQPAYLEQSCMRCRFLTIKADSLICQHCNYDNTEYITRVENSKVRISDKERADYNRNKGLSSEGKHYCSTCQQWFDTKEEYTTHHFKHTNCSDI